MKNLSTSSLLTFLAEEEYYEHVRLTDNPEVAIGLGRFIFTVAVCVIDRYSIRQRWCYGNYRDAKAALDKWDGKGDPTGPWIKSKGRAGGYSNPMKSEE